MRKGDLLTLDAAEGGDPISGAAPAIVPLPPRIVWAGEGMGLAEIGTAAVVLWRGELTHAKHARQIEHYARTIAAFPGRAGIMSVLEANAPTPNEALRRESAHEFKRLSTRVTGLACVVEATGFVGAFQRSVLSGMSLLLPKGHADITFCANVRTGAEWLAPRCEGVAVDALCKLVEQLRSRL